MKFIIHNLSKINKNNLFTYFKDTIFSTPKPIPLGRWNYENADIKSNFANLDNCGDKICGSPEILSQTYKLSNISDAKSNLDVDSRKVIP